MDEIEIEHGIPIPKRRTLRSGLTDVLRQMNVGDSIVVPYGQSNAIPSIAQRLGIRTTRDKITSTHWRVWRIE